MLQVDQAGSTTPSDPQQVIDFSDLTPRQQRIFRNASSSGGDLVQIPSSIDEAVWVKHDFVRYQNQIYPVAVAVC